MLEIANKRRKEMKESPDKEWGDFLEVLLTLDSYKNKDSLIVDECNNFFTAGSGTVSSAT